MPPMTSEPGKRQDPYDPHTGATGNDEPEERSGERSSPGSGEDEDHGGAADLQPADVEQGDPAR